MSKHFIETPVTYKSLDFLGFPNHRIGTDVSVWSNRKEMRLVTIKNKGYKVVTLSYKGTEKRFYIHRLMLLAFVGPCPEGMQCRHLNGKPWGNRLSNLKWGTPKKNQKDRIRHDTDNRGIKNGRVKLTEDDVRTIRKLYATGNYSFGKLGRLYGIHYSTIADAVRRLTWPHVK